jgi:hypothetical protein
MKTKIATNKLQCTACGAEEQHPTKATKILIRGYKVSHHGRWWSQCLVCSGYWDEQLNETPLNHNPNKGWF